MEWNTVERAKKTETDTRAEKKKEWASSVDFCQRHKPQHPRNVKVSPWGPARCYFFQRSRKRHCQSGQHCNYLAATLGKLRRDRMRRVWAFSSTRPWTERSSHSICLRRGTSSERPGLFLANIHEVNVNCLSAIAQLTKMNRWKTRRRAVRLS